MAKSLLFIPDISGFTHFVQTTEVEHSQHVISELLEVLIDANSEDLELAEIEGDALFFFKENDLLSADKLFSLVENMYVAFYSHLKMLETNRICPCSACETAINLRLKIIAHAGDLQFINVKNKRKPFGNPVIQTHRLLKNSIDSDNYFLLSQTYANELGINKSTKKPLLNFNVGSNIYDEVNIDYLFSDIDVEKLSLRPYKNPQKVEFSSKPNMVFNKEFNVAANVLLENITNYRFRHMWTEGLDRIEFSPNEVTRVGTEHLCVVGGQHLEFITVTKDGEDDEIVYGELTTSPPPIDELYQFYIIKKSGENKSHLKLELFWFTKNPIKKVLISIFGKREFKKKINAALGRLQGYLSEI